MSIFLKCDEAAHICDKNQYHEATIWDKIKLTIHLIYCAVCRKYVSRNNALTSLIKKSEVKTMPIESKEAVKEKLRQEMAE